MIPTTSTEVHLMNETEEDESAAATNAEEDHEQSSDEPNANIVDEEDPQAETESQAPLDEDLYDQSEHTDTIDDSQFDQVEETTSVEQRLKKISEEIEKYSSNENDANGRQSFFSLSDLIKTLRPSDKKLGPQIDSSYSNTMHVLGETASIVGGDAEGRKIKTIDLRTANRALFQASIDNR